MKEILIVSATSQEIAPFLTLSGTAPEARTRIAGHAVRVCSTGVGVVAATFHIRQLTAQYNPALIVQAGIGGAYPDASLNVGDTVTVGTETLADLGVCYPEGFRNRFPEDRTLVNPDEYPELPFPRVRGNTVSCACSPLVQKGDAAIESMEGYALFYVCTRLGIPFLELRTVSNLVSTDRSSWNPAAATASLALALEETLTWL